METVVLLLFIIALIASLVLDVSVMWALVAGYIIFGIYTLKKGFTIKELLEMSFEGIKTTANMLITLMLIGVMTALWRASGTIASIVCYVSGLLSPSVLLIAIFLLNSLVSFLTGSSFATAATMGVISMTLANAAGCSPVLAGGAMLSGAFFGDRCSPVSTSALLCAELTGTDIYRNVSAMFRCCIVPLVISCVAFVLLGLSTGNGAAVPDLTSAFGEEFTITPIALIPALLILVLSAFRIKVKYAMIISSVTAAAICLFIQKQPVLELLKTALLGYETKTAAVAAMMSGGGAKSMFSVVAIVCLSATYSGIFQKTGLLDGVQNALINLGKGKPPIIGVLVAAVSTSAVSCNQTLAIMLAHQICQKLNITKEDLVIDLENTVVLIPALMPWSIAGAVPVSSAGAPTGCVLAAIFLILMPIWACVYRSIEFYRQKPTTASPR